MQAHLIMTVGLALAAAVAAAPAGGTTFVETFDNGNVGSWTFGNAYESIQLDGVTRGYHLRNVLLDSIAPQPRTGAGDTSVFTGDYQTRGVSAVGADLRIYRVDFTSRQRPVSVILGSDSGTPTDPTDDCRVFSVGQKPLPAPGGGWMTYDFAIPSASVTMPDGWKVLGDCAGLDPDSAWLQVITDVDRLSFFGGDPELFFIFQVWDVGLDNPRITYEAP